MKKVVRLSESDLDRIVKKVLKEQSVDEKCADKIKGIKVPESCKPPVASDQKFNMKKCYDDIKKESPDVQKKIKEYLLCLTAKLPDIGFPKA